MRLVLTAAAVALVLSACGNGPGGPKRVYTAADGSKIDFLPKAAGLVSESTTDGKLAAWNQSESTYGVWVKNDGSLQDVFYRGDTTKNAPTTGTFTYNGAAFRVNAGNPAQAGSSTIEVNFDTGTVNGTINVGGAGTEAINSNIIL